MAWTVWMPRRIERHIQTLPRTVQQSLVTLLREMELNGPVRPDWPNYGKLRGTPRYHCHLKKGHPTYVAVWEVRDPMAQLIEVTYVGTHENAPY
jgi:hypothetical protein